MQVINTVIENSTFLLFSWLLLYIWGQRGVSLINNDGSPCSFMTPTTFSVTRPTLDSNTLVKKKHSSYFLDSLCNFLIDSIHKNKILAKKSFRIMKF